MSEEVYDAGHLRRYLLGDLNDEEQQMLEERLLGGDELIDLIPVAEEELIDDYVEGALTAAEVEKFESFFVLSPERQRKLNFAKALRRYVRVETANESPAPQTASQPIDRNPVIVHPSSKRKGVFSNSYLRLAAAAVILLGLGFAVWRIVDSSSRVSKGMAALREAYPEHRPIEARISDWNYASSSPVLRGDDQMGVDYVKRDLARALIQLEAAEHPSAHSFHDLARLYLAERDFDKAIDQFEKALKLDDRDAQIHSDLGAALLEKGKIDRANGESAKGFEELARCIEHLNRAIELKGSLLEAVFNRALAHQEMALPEQAEEDWRRYLERDSTSKWADEARQNLRSLEERKSRTSRTRADILQDFVEAYEAGNNERAWDIVSHSRDGPSGQMIWEQLLDRFLEGSRTASQSAAHNLEVLSFLGNLELGKAGDSFNLGLARFYKSATTKQLPGLIQARELNKLGHQYSLEGNPLEAAKTFRECKKIFVSCGDEWEAEYAEQWIGYSCLQSSLTQESVTILTPLIGSFERQHHQWMLMRTLHLLSGAEYNLGEYSRAIEHNQRALALANEMGDAIGIFNTSSILAEQYRYIDNRPKALVCVAAGLSILDSCALSPLQIAQHYGIAALSLMVSGFYPAAIDYQKESLRRGLELGRPRLISQAYTRLALIYGKCGNFSEAIENATLAHETAKSISEQSLRNTMMALSSLALGDLYREHRKFGKAIERYDQALALYSTLDFQFGVLEVHRNSLLCRLATDDIDASKNELKATLDLIEKHRATILEGDNRNKFFENAQSVYDVAIEFAYSKMGDSEQAFDYSEESRSRTLLDSVNGGAQVSKGLRDPDIVLDPDSEPLKPLTVAKLKERLPRQVQLLQYAVLDDKILIWTLSNSEGLLIQEKKIGKSELKEKVTAYLRALNEGSEVSDEQANKYAGELFDYLIRPVQSLLDPDKTLCIVPDKILNYLPFGALRSSDSGRYLVQDYTTVISPSATLLVICSETADQRSRPVRERILSVGNPRFNRALFSNLPDLPSAAREAREVAGYYDSRCLLTEDDAKEKSVRAEMQRADVIHFAVHSDIDPRSPLKSKLLLAGGAREGGAQESADGFLEAREVYGLTLPRARVVLLSACQTGVQEYWDGEGMISFARPFLSAGAPLVVASLWRVESNATAQLMISLHKHRKMDGVSTAAALRLAQQEMIGNSEEKLHRPKYWASFIAIGGSTAF